MCMYMYICFALHSAKRDPQSPSPEPDTPKQVVHLLYFACKVPPPNTKHQRSSASSQKLSTKTPNTQHPTPDTKYQTPNTKHQTPNTKHQTSCSIPILLPSEIGMT